MNKANELICVHSIWIYLIALSLGIFFVAGWLPPVSPGLDGESLKAMLVEDVTRIRIGLALAAFGSIFWWSFTAAIATQMRRIEGDHHSLSFTQLVCGTGTVLPVLLPSFIWLGMLYRVESLPVETVQLFNDTAWLTFIGMFGPGVLQNITLGICILNGKGDVKPYPRWVAYLCFWVSFLFMPAALLPFFHSGPFAWNGLLGFWMVAVAFFVWILVVWWMTVKAIKESPE